MNDLDDERVGVKALLDEIVRRVPAPSINEREDVKMLISQTESNKFFGRMMIGKIEQGRIETG